MIQLNCTNNELKSVLEKLSITVTENGGVISDEVFLVENNGDLSIHSTLSANSTEDLITIPETCLPCIDDFGLAIAGDELRIESNKPTATELHLEIMSLMVRIYNLTGKIAWHRKTSPWFSLFNAPKVLQLLYDGRAKTLKLHSHLDLFKAEKYDQLLIDSFMGARTFSLKSDAEENTTKRLLPFIDFINHHHSGFPFRKKILADNNRALFVTNSKPVPGSDEVFVTYNRYDALDTYWFYNFEDTNAPFVRSKPLSFSLLDFGTIYIESRVAPPLKKAVLPDFVHDLRYYIPRILAVEDQKIHLSHIIIPGENAPKAMLRTLEFIIHTARQELDQDRIHEMALFAEYTILTENIGYYLKLQKSIEAIENQKVSNEVVDTLKNLVAKQLDMLKAYSDRQELNLNCN